MAQASVSTTIRLSVELSNRLEDYCRSSGESKTAAITTALDEYLSKQPL